MTSYEGALGEARRRLEAGELVIHPTEAVYGLGGFLEDGPLARLRGLKDRPAGGFVVLIPSARSVANLLDADGRALARAFWPGPMTLVLSDPADRFHPGAKAPDGSVAVRVPAHPLTLRLLRDTGRPVTSTSANRPGAPPAVTAEEAREAMLSLGTEPFALDAGPLPGGAASTLVSLHEDCPILIRQGPLDVLRLNEVMRRPLSVPPGGDRGGCGGEGN
ncbi:MAG: L-threonylcarbamoyladenylate synthase [Gemmatimonadetes bacterium]|nr:L-threonylcarbamoyladenylate synthase [Gemmatimonadota bacterium]MYC00188.1 L-threonylcarbamoyladenylate synthase [Gemmatimonadota bacterium]